MMVLDRLISKIRNNDCILWLGSGFSLYAGIPSAGKLREEILKECEMEEREILNEISSLADFTEEFVQLRNGSKNDLYRILSSCISVPTQNYWVHELLTEIPQFDTIITTNYDRLLETSYQNEIYPIIYNSNVPFASNKRVALYKIHGDIHFPDTILITKSDYTKFFTKENSDIWNKVKTLLSEKTIIFVGYSLEDQNIDYLLDNVMESIGNFRRESFLISPNLREHKVKRLTTKNIQYINMTGEEFVKAVHSKIKQNLLEDIMNQKVSMDVGLPILKKYGLFPNILVNHKGATIESLGTNRSSTPLHFNFTFNDADEELKDIFDPPSFKEVEISSEKIQTMRTHYDGITIPIIEGPFTLIIKPLPTNQSKVDLLFKNNDLQITNAYMEVFGNSLSNMLIKITHPFFELSISEKEKKLNFSTHKFSRLTDAKQVFDFLLCMISYEEPLTIYMVEEDKEVELNRLIQDVNHEHLENTKNILSIIEKLLVIQKHYKVHFRNFEIKFNHEDLDCIHLLYLNAKNEKHQIQWFKVPVKITQPIEFEELLNPDKIFKFQASSHSPLEFKLLGETFIIDKKIIYESYDAYVSNINEIKQDIEKKKEYTTLMIKSREKGVFRYLD